MDGCGAEEVNSCTGICCRAFTVGNNETYEQLEERLGTSDDLEMLYILDMIIPVAYYGDIQDVPRFTCCYWDPWSGLCTDYDNRPKMCSDFPYDKPCYHCGLTMRMESD